MLFTKFVTLGIACKMEETTKIKMRPDTNHLYRGRMTSVVFDDDVIKLTDELRGDITRTRWVNSAVREYNQKMARVKQKLAEIQEDLEKNEKRVNALLQNSSSVTSPKGSAVGSEVPKVNSPHHRSTTEKTADDDSAAVPTTAMESDVPVSR